MTNKIFNFLKVIIINFFIFLSILIVSDLIFGNWFNNSFKTRLSSERNINRVYKFNFENYQGASHYIRDNSGFRINEKETIPEKINIIFTGGSTTNQKFINYEDTLVGLLEKKFENISFVNAGIDGLSIVGHINSFEYWFDKINNLSPDYYIYFIGINDQYLFTNESTNAKTRAVDNLVEPRLKGKIREYLEANSFIYNKIRLTKSALYLKFGLSIGANIVNSKGVVYGKRENKTFVTYETIKKKNLANIHSEKKYLELLKKLTNKVNSRSAEPIYITQTSGNGMNNNLLLISKVIMKHCRDENLYCINMPSELDLNYDDFYDDAHLNPTGSKKVSEYLFKKLSSILYKKT